MLRVSSFKFQENGQTLIETIVAIFIMTTGLSSGLALAVYSFGASTEIAEQIVATGLAREGIEAARSFRDSNWMAGTLTDCGGGQLCYATWLGGAVDGGVYRVAFDSQSSASKLTFDPTPYSGINHYRLYEQAAGGFSHNPLGGHATRTNFFRKLSVIVESTSGDYTAISPLVLVRTSVWWYGKRCNNSLTDLTDPSQTSCKIITEEYLTNWRNY